MIRRRSPLKRKPRKPSEFKRIYGSRARVAWVKRQPCIVTTGVCAGPIENAHIVTGGMGRKADADQIVPLCNRHHHNLHGLGRESFERLYLVSLAACAAQTEQQWQARGAC